MTEPIYKYNNGNGALLCSDCSVIIKEGNDFTENEAQYCEKCKYIRTNSKLSEQEWVELTRKFVKQYSGGHQRIGQAYINAIRDMKVELYDEIAGTQNDCFYDDKKIIDFIRFLNGDNNE